MLYEVITAARSETGGGEPLDRAPGRRRAVAPGGPADNIGPGTHLWRRRMEHDFGAYLEIARIQSRNNFV